jgi:hypothetical protein
MPQTRTSFAKLQRDKSVHVRVGCEVAGTRLAALRPACTCNGGMHPVASRKLPVFY